MKGQQKWRRGCNPGTKHQSSVTLDEWDLEWLREVQEDLSFMVEMDNQPAPTKGCLYYDTETDTARGCDTGKTIE